MTRKQRAAVIEVLQCAADPSSSSGIMDERNGGYETADYALRERLSQERMKISDTLDPHADVAPGVVYALSCLELAQRIADEEWP